MSQISGLHSITKRLLALDKNLTTPEQRARWKTMQKMIPPLLSWYGVQVESFGSILCESSPVTSPLSLVQ